jgi:hypothetical protein
MRSLLLPILIVALSSCATYKPAVETKVDNEKVINASYDKVWTKIISFVSSNGMNVKTIDKASGLVSFERAYDPSFAGKYMDCGRMVSASEATKGGPNDSKAKEEKKSGEMQVVGGLMSMNFFVQKVSDKSTSVRINVFGKVTTPAATNLYGQPTGVAADHSCFSKGAFEQEVFAFISK